MSEVANQPAEGKEQPTQVAAQSTDEMSSKQRPTPSLRRRWCKRLGIAFLCLCTLLGAGLGYIWYQLQPERLRTHITEALAASIDADIQIAHAELGELTADELLIHVEGLHIQAHNKEGPAALDCHCLLYTSPSPRDGATSRMPSSA